MQTSLHVETFTHFSVRTSAALHFLLYVYMVAILVGRNSLQYCSLRNLRTVNTLVFLMVETVHMITCSDTVSLI